MKTLLLLLLAFPAFAQVKTFTVAMNAVGASAAQQVDSVNHTVQIVVVSPTTCTARLEGTADGVNWADLSGSQPCTANTMFHVDGKLVLAVRVYLITYAGDAGGAFVNFKYLGSR